MGGHGALICALREPEAWESVSAFSPICHPSECPWGVKAFSHYLGEDQTLGRMQKDFVYPTLGDRTSPKEWEANGRPDLVAKARARKERILSAQNPVALAPALDKSLRTRFPIRL